MKETDTENFQGFYDKENVKKFLTDFDILEDYYPQPARRLLISIVSDFYDWREIMLQSIETTYSILNQIIENHTFCEVGQRQRINNTDKYLILNHRAHTLGTAFNISFDHQETLLESIETKQGLSDWFNNNRIPSRNFQVIPKHGENRHDIRIINGKTISPLRCSGAHAGQLLKNALGENIRELYNFDGAYFIVYKYEGNNEQNMYHGYHVELTSNEVPDWIKQKLIARAGQNVA